MTIDLLRSAFSTFDESDSLVNHPVTLLYDCVSSSCALVWVCKCFWCVFVGFIVQWSGRRTAAKSKCTNQTERHILRKKKICVNKSTSISCYMQCKLSIGTESSMRNVKHMFRYIDGVKSVFGLHAPKAEKHTHTHTPSQSQPTLQPISSVLRRNFVWWKRSKNNLIIIFN